MKHLYLACILVLGSIVSQGDAAVIPAASCSRQAVQQAVDQASPGDTVRLPACRETGWAGTVTLDKPLTLEGSGTSQTRLERANVAGGYEDNPMFLVTGRNVTIRNLSMDGTRDTRENGHVDFGIFVHNAVDFRIHHTALSNFAVAIQVRGNPQAMRGLIDHNTISDNWWKNLSTGQAFGYGVSVVGDGRWLPVELGTVQNVFIEDNTFARNRHSIAANNGARYVFRHNTIQNNREDAQAIDAHGKVRAWPVGTRQYEIYDNTVTNSLARFAGVYVGGGTGVIFHNRFSGNLNREILLDDASGCPGGRIPAPQYRMQGVGVWGNTVHEGGAASVSVDRGCEGAVRQGEAYQLTAPEGYTPYRYPHPLATGGSAIADPLPRAPRNLRLLQQ